MLSGIVTWPECRFWPSFWLQNFLRVPDGLFYRKNPYLHTHSAQLNRVIDAQSFAIDRMQREGRHNSWIREFVVGVASNRPLTVLKQYDETRVSWAP